MVLAESRGDQQFDVLAQQFARAVTKYFFDTRVCG
jgi:hypothetical protein